MADVDPTTDPAFDIEEDGADALVADFIVSALDQVDGTQGFEDDAARFRQQPAQFHVPVPQQLLKGPADLCAGSADSGCREGISDPFLPRLSRE
jgi:hypothetical protein